MGLGSGLLAVTSPTILAMFFSKRRLLAGGIASTGGGVGEWNIDATRSERSKY